MGFLLTFACVVSVLTWAIVVVGFIISGVKQDELGPGLRRIGLGLLILALGFTFEIWWLSNHLWEGK
jgi:urea transporter